MNTVTVNCQTCGKPFERLIQRGRPALRCPVCRAEANAKSLGELSITVESITPSTTSEFKTKETVGTPVDVKILKSHKIQQSVFIPTTFQVLVGGGIGTVYAGESEKEAKEVFNNYEKKSSWGFGQVGFEIVEMWKLNKETNGYDSIKKYDPLAERAQG